MPWLPDEQLIPAMKTGRCSRRYKDLTEPDRAWVIVGLVKAGMTAEHIAELLGCSLRTVWMVRAEPLAAVVETYQEQMQAWEQDHRMLRSELARTMDERDKALRCADRYRLHVDRLTARRNSEGVRLCSKGLHEMDYGNTYEHGGRRFCRACRARFSAQHRARQKVSA